MRERDTAHGTPRRACGLNNTARSLRIGKHNALPASQEVLAHLATGEGVQPRGGSGEELGGTVRHAGVCAVMHSRESEDGTHGQGAGGPKWTPGQSAGQ